MHEEHRNENVNAQQVRREAHRVRHFLVKVGVVYAAISVALYFGFSALMSDHAYEDMSRDEINHISAMVFESMYSAMLAGQSREQIEAASQRFNDTGPGMQVSVIRGDLVAELFGEEKIDTMRRINDLAIFDVFKSGEQALIHKDMSIRFLYPAKFKQPCQQCHTNAKVGEVAAVVEVIYPIVDLKVSTHYVNSLMLAYFITSFIVLIIFLKMSFRRR